MASRTVTKESTTCRSGRDAARIVLTVPGDRGGKRERARRPRRRSNTWNARILLVEDNLVNQDLAQAVLQQWRVRVDIASDGKQALNALRRESYDLVFMDVQMPEMDGLEATSHIRHPGSGVLDPKVPIVAMTAHAMQEDRERCLEAGMDDYLSRPINPTAQLQVLRRFLHEARQNTLPESTSEDALPMVFDQAGFRSRLMGNSKFAVRIIQTFLRDCPQRLSSIEAALEGGDSAALARELHTLKGTSAALGGEALRGKAMDLEALTKAGNHHAVRLALPSLHNAAHELRAALQHWAGYPSNIAPRTEESPSREGVQGSLRPDGQHGSAALLGHRIGAMATVRARATPRNVARVPLGRLLTRSRMSRCRCMLPDNSARFPGPFRTASRALATLLTLNSCALSTSPDASMQAHSQRRAASPNAVDGRAGAPSSGGTAGMPQTVDEVARAGADGGSDVGVVDSSLTLRKAAEKSGRWIGAALGTYHLGDATYSAVAATEFNYLTPENEMKWIVTERAPSEFDFVGGDALVAFAEEHQMRVKGHCLVWYSQLPNWVKALETADEVRLAMTRHIQQVAGHFRGKIAAWDVVNEAIDDGNANALRDNVFLQYLGEGYIDEAFHLARAADPGALLFYNDYSIEGLGGKSDAAYALVKRLVESGVPIDGVGLQMHIGVGYPSAADIESNIRRLGDLGLLVNISEFDVNLCDYPGDQSAKFEVQRQRYHDVVAACLAVPKCQAITLWGVTDKYSWLNRFMPCSSPDEAPWGLPWDDSYVRKPAWMGIADALLGRADNADAN